MYVSFSQQIGIKAWVIRLRITTKFEVDKFNGRDDFSLWHVKMCALLIQQGLSKALKGRKALPSMMFDEKNDKLMEKAYGVILLRLSNEMLHEIAEEDTATKLWL